MIREGEPEATLRYLSQTWDRVMRLTTYTDGMSPNSLYEPRAAEVIKRFEGLSRIGAVTWHSHQTAYKQKHLRLPLKELLADLPRL